jgi:hypothetical protein
MKNEFLFSASFRIRHPVLAADYILSAIPLYPRIINSVGMQRKTRQGDSLPGVYDRTYLSFPLDVSYYDSLEGFISSQIEKDYLSNEEFLRSLRQSGGEVEFFLGLCVYENKGIVLDHDLICRLARKSISLSFDLYGGNDEEK